MTDIVIQGAGPRKWLENLLLSTSLTTLAVIVPLNSLILAHPNEPICLRCLGTVYVVPILILWVWHSLIQNVWGGKLYKISLRTLTLVAVIAFLNLVQRTTIPPGWRTIYVVISVFLVSPLVYSFVHGKQDTASLLLMFALIMSPFEAGNFATIVKRAGSVASPSFETSRDSDPHSGSRHSPHVFLLVLDEFALKQILRHEELDPEVVPNLEEFARSATWFRRAVTLYPGTEQSIPTILTGRDDHRTFEQEFLEGRHTDQVFSVLGKTHEIFISGYALPYCKAFAPYLLGCRNYQMGFSNYALIFRNWWDRAVPGEMRKLEMFGRARRTLTTALGSYYEGIRATLTDLFGLGQNFRRPTFTYVHAGLPHSPYVFRANGEIGSDLTEDRWVDTMTADELVQARLHYREQITYTDALFGSFVREMRNRGVYEESIIIVTSDHGISFNPVHPGRDERVLHDEEVADEVARVPLFIKRPWQQQGGIDDQPHSLVDVYQVVLEASRSPEPIRAKK